MEQKIKTSWPRLVTLVVVSTLIAELLSGSTPFSRITQILPQFLLYGTGAILVREITRRRRLGWATIIVLGFAFGYILEGWVLQSVFNPHFLGLDISFGRAAGVNWVWAEYLPGLHAFWSISASILFCEAVFPGDRQVPWVGDTGLWITGLIFLLVCVGFHFLFIKIMHFRAPAIGSLFCLLWVIALVVLALNLPAAPIFTGRGKDPRPVYSFWIIAFLTFAAGASWLMGIQMIFAREKVGLWLALSSGLLTVLVYFFLLAKWGLTAIRTDRDRLAVATGLVWADLVLGYTGTLDNKIDHYGQIILIVLTVPLLFYLFKRDERKGSAANS